MHIYFLIFAFYCKNFIVLKKIVGIQISNVDTLRVWHIAAVSRALQSNLYLLIRRSRFFNFDFLAFFFLQKHLTLRPYIATRFVGID